MLVQYDGTVLLVSHDRAFLDNVVSSILVFEGYGRVTEYVGGYLDYQSSAVSIAEQPSVASSSVAVERPISPDYEDKKRQRNAQKKLERELEKLPALRY